MTVGLFVIISYEKAISESHAKGALMKCSSVDEFQESHEINATLLGGGGGRKKLEVWGMIYHHRQ